MTSTPASMSNAIESRTGRATRSGATYNPHLVLDEEDEDLDTTHVERQATNAESVNNEHDDNSDQGSVDEPENHLNNQHDVEQEPGPRAPAPAQATPGQAPIPPTDPTGIAALAAAISQLVQGESMGRALGRTKGENER